MPGSKRATPTWSESRPSDRMGILPAAFHAPTLIIFGVVSMARRVPQTKIWKQILAMAKKEEKKQKAGSSSGKGKGGVGIVTPLPRMALPVVQVRHGGGPGVYVGSGLTTCAKHHYLLQHLVTNENCVNSWGPPHTRGRRRGPSLSRCSTDGCGGCRRWADTWTACFALRPRRCPQTGSHMMTRVHQR
jgi:hypothetical protein